MRVLACQELFMHEAKKSDCFLCGLNARRLAFALNLAFRGCDSIGGCSLGACCLKSCIVRARLTVALSVVVIGHHSGQEYNDRRPGHGKRGRERSEIDGHQKIMPFMPSRRPRTRGIAAAASC